MSLCRNGCHLKFWLVFYPLILPLYFSDFSDDSPLRLCFVRNMLSFNSFHGSLLLTLKRKLVFHAKLCFPIESALGTQPWHRRVSFIPQFHRSVVSMVLFSLVQKTCIKYQGTLMSFSQWFSGSSLHQNHLEGWLKHWVVGPTTSVWVGRLGVWWGLRMCICNKVPSLAGAAGPSTTFWESWA